MKTHLFAPLLSLILLFAAFAPIESHAAPLAPGAGRFEFSRGTRTIPIWYFLPGEMRAETPVLIVMHGVKRDADRYRDGPRLEFPVPGAH